MFEQCLPILHRAEAIAATRPVNEVLVELRELCLWDFGLLLVSMPITDFPNLSRLLPRMATEDVQNSWTGESGVRLLSTTLDFVRLMSVHFHRLRRRALDGIRVMDFGCGYGRIMRPMYYFTDPELIYGIDPWDRSLAICREDGVLGHLEQSDYLPASLPAPEGEFDIIYSYSVFTHTSLEATSAALTTLRRYIAPGGVLVLTTRPIEYWNTPSLREKPGFSADRHFTEHRQVGFSFLPSTWNKHPDGNSIFGDTSIDPDWIARTFPQWAVRGYDRGIDTLQTLVFLTPR